jgi:Ca2+/Na+ antiporter
VGDEDPSDAESAFVEAHMLVKIYSAWIVTGRAAQVSRLLQHPNDVSAMVVLFASSVYRREIG